MQVCMYLQNGLRSQTIELQVIELDKLSVKAGQEVMRMQSEDINEMYSTRQAKAKCNLSYFLQYDVLMWL